MVGSYSGMLGVPDPSGTLQAAAGGAGNITLLALAVHTNGTKVGGAQGGLRLQGGGSLPPGAAAGSGGRGACATAGESSTPRCAS